MASTPCSRALSSPAAFATLLMTIATSAPGMRPPAAARISASMLDPRPEIRMPIFFIMDGTYWTYRTCKIRESHKSYMSFSFCPKVRFEQLQNPLVFIRPARCALEAVIFDRVGGQFPILFPQFNQALDQPHCVLEMDIDVDHAVADQQRALQTFREIDRRALLVGFGVALRRVEDVRRVAMVVMRPIGDGAQRGPGGEDVGFGEHGHQRDEAAVT